MEMLLILILALLPPSSSTCLFSVLIISSSSSFPSNCTRLEGRFRVDHSSDLADSQLVELFANVRELHGVVQIWNSRLTTANFLANIRRITGDLLDNSISIVNNTLLTSINLTSLEYSDGKVEIQNNPLLDLKPNCPALHKSFFNRRSISSLECGCQVTGTFSYPKNINFPENCVVLYGNFIINDVAPPFELLYRLLSVRKLYGFLEVRNTNLETLGFLQNLEEIESGPDDEITVSIGSEMTWLGRVDLIKLNSIKSRNPRKSVISISAKCLDPALVQLVAHSDIQDIKLSGSYCPLDRINNPSFYCTGPIGLISERCTRYIGNLLYFNPKNYFWMELKWNYTVVPDKDWKKIQQLEFIFGSLIIEGSALEEISLPNLQEIYQITKIYHNNMFYNQAMLFTRNYNLTKVSIPNLKNGLPVVQFEENPRLQLSHELCDALSNGTRRIEFYFLGDFAGDCRNFGGEYFPIDE